MSLYILNRMPNQLHEWIIIVKLSCCIGNTIEYIKTQKSFGVMLDNNRETIAEVTRVTPSYKLADRAKFIRIK